MHRPTRSFFAQYNKLFYGFVGLIVLLLLLALGAAYFLQPTLNRLIIKELSKYGLKCDQARPSFTGNIELKNITLPLKENGKAFIGQLVGRPPILFLKGHTNAYNITVFYKDLMIKIPQLSIDGLQKNSQGRFMSTQDKAVKALNKLAFGSVFIPELSVYKDKKILLAEVHDVLAKNYSQGILSSLTLGLLRAKDTKNNAFVNLHKASLYNICLLELYKLTQHKNKEQHPFSILNGLNILGLDARFFLINNSYKIQLKSLKIDHLDTIACSASTEERSYLLKNLKASFADFRLKKENATATLDDEETGGSFSQKFSKLSKLLMNKPLKVDGTIDYSYDINNQTILLKNTFLNLEDLGDVKISAQLLHVSKDVFSKIKQKALEAQKKLRFLRGKFLYQDKGLLNQVIANLAAQTELSVGDIHELFSTVLQKSPALLIADKAMAKDISDNLLDFLNNPQSLLIALKAKDREGVPLSPDDSENSEKDSHFLDKVDLQIISNLD